MSKWSRAVLSRVDRFAVTLHRRFLEPRVIPNLKGERDVEYAWIAAHLPEGPGRVLDFGCGSSWMGFVAAHKGLTVTCIDLITPQWFLRHPRVAFVQGDLLHIELSERDFDIVICCSTIEHVGIPGRFGVSDERSNGDLEAMERLNALTRPNGTLLLTLPVGRDRVFPPDHRVYGAGRLPELLSGWTIVKEQYWLKDDRNCWFVADRGDAVQLEPSRDYYALGLFVLRKPGDRV